MRKVKKISETAAKNAFSSVILVYGTYRMAGKLRKVKEILEIAAKSAVSSVILVYGTYRMAGTEQIPADAHRPDERFTNRCGYNPES